LRYFEYEITEGKYKEENESVVERYKKSMSLSDLVK